MAFACSSVVLSYWRKKFLCRNVKLVEFVTFVLFLFVFCQCLSDFFSPLPQLLVTVYALIVPCAVEGLHSGST